MAFVSDLVSADCTLRHVETISSEQLGQRLLHVPKKLLVNLVVNCKHLASGFARADIDGVGCLLRLHYSSLRCIQNLEVRQDLSS